jgi:hypothetical protein
MRSSRLTLGWWYLVIVGVIATVVALFEVWGIAHYRVAWGEPLPQDKVWGKPLIQKAPFSLVGFQLLTRYHFFMYCVLVPAFVLSLSLLLGRMAASRPAHGLGWLIFTIAGTLGVMVSEDFLFFLFSTIFGTPYPGALTRLFRGEATWHPSQVSFFGLFKLPSAYIWIPPIAALLLWFVSRFEL